MIENMDKHEPTRQHDELVLARLGGGTFRGIASEFKVAASTVKRAWIKFQAAGGLPNE